MRRRYLLLLSLLFVYCLVRAQQRQSQYNAYCEVTVGSTGMDQFINITFDFGYTRYPNALLYDDKGQPIKFRSPMDAVNYLGERGWRVVTSYYSNDTKGQLRHYIMEKRVSNRQQIEEGLRLSPNPANKQTTLIPPSS